MSREKSKTEKTLYCRIDAINQTTSKWSFTSLSFLNRWNNNAYTNKYGKKLGQFLARGPNAPSRRLKPKIYNTVKGKKLSVGEFKYMLTLIYAVLQIW